MPPLPTAELLRLAVAELGGVDRPGQTTMAEAVGNAFATGDHLLVQAGTGTGKSLAYLVPALQHALETDKPVIVATATLALQGQIVERDLPALVDALAPHLARRPSFVTLKGRQHYLCQRKLNGDAGPEDAPTLLEAPTSRLGREVKRVREWAGTTGTGHRDELTPAVTDRAWGQVSVPARDCVGASRCSFGDTCFAERARESAEKADIVVTNHALLAIDALDGVQALPEHDAVVVDEAHDLVDRVTSAATQELAPPMVEMTAARCARLGDTVSDQVETLRSAGEAFESAFEELPPGRVTQLPSSLGTALRLLTSAARDLQSALTRIKGGDNPQHRLGWNAAESLRGIAERCEAFSDQDVLWVSEDDRRGNALHVAPLNVGGLLAAGLFADRSVVLTSATLQLGGDFAPVARAVGLRPGPDAGWVGIDVGSPFDYPKQAMLYVAGHLPTPGRDGASPAATAELIELITAAGGRTLGLFSSMRAAEAAAETVREALEVTVFCQGEAQTGELIRKFAADDRSCLFGTLSLWQGVDVPGSSLHLVVVDRIPFPRPDDPLLAARAAQENLAGRNGFLGVFAASAAVRLAQGVGRLIRSHSDRGVVAVLDSRLATARYGAFLLSTLPPFWVTRDPQQVRRSLVALDEAEPAVGPTAATRPVPRTPGSVTVKWRTVRDVPPAPSAPTPVGPPPSSAPVGTDVERVDTDPEATLFDAVPRR